MAKYIIAKSQCESLLTTKESWEIYPDDILNPIKEFEAESWDEACNIYDSIINEPFYHDTKKEK